MPKLTVENGSSKKVNTLSLKVIQRAKFNADGHSQDRELEVCARLLRLS